MILETFRHLWGVDTPAAQFIPTLPAAGYQGVETRVPELKDQDAFAGLLKDNGLKYIPQIFTGGKTVAEHLASFETQVKSAAALSPVLINCHSGADWFSPAEALEFYRGALKMEQNFGVPIGHETHRGRVFFNPWITRDVLNEFPELTLTCDFSHWVCVAERLLEGCEDIIELCAGRCIHIHARVGHAEGPQVSDPRAPEFAGALSAHERWWNQIWASQRARGAAISTLTPEFGPPGYMPTLPHTRQPVASLPEICDWMAVRQRGRFGA